MSELVKECDSSSHGASRMGSNPILRIEFVLLFTKGTTYTALAQLVERRTLNPAVVGSSPTSGEGL